MKILFLIHDLGQGGAEKVLVNLVNNMDREKFDITVISLFGGGVNEQFLNKRITYRTVFKRSFPGNSHLMKLLSPRMLHKLCINENYDIEVSYLEGPSARVISGCNDPGVKLVSWIHSTIPSKKAIAASFRNYREAVKCYSSMDRMAFVSKGVRSAFLSNMRVEKPCLVLYNTVESDVILRNSEEPAPMLLNDGSINLISVGSLKPVKGYDRLIRITGRLLKDGYNVRLYILGKGPQQQELEKCITENALGGAVTLLGYDTNPYKYVAKCDLFVCSSHSEGFSTAVTEALIVGTPVCTVDVSGMKELLGENNEYGVVTENNEESLYEGIKGLLDKPLLLAHYREKAVERSRSFSTAATVKAVEDALEQCVNER